VTLTRVCLLVGFAISNVASILAATDAAQLEKQFQSSVAPFLKSFCLDCHGGDDPAAKLDLSGYSSADQIAKEHQTWAIVLDRLRAGEMPPKDSESQPTDKQRQAIVDWIKSAREFEAERNAGDPGPVLARRLSNSEYNYSIRDLTGVDIRPTKTFPVDPANEAGFDNTGESLTMSPALLKKYLDAARLVTEHLVLKPDGIAFAPHAVVTDTDRDKYCVKRIVQFYKRQPTELADYFEAAWELRQIASKQGDALSAETTLKQVAAKRNVSAKYLATVWSILTEEKEPIGPLLTLRQMWNVLPNDPNQRRALKAACQRMSDFVVRVRSKLRPKFDDLYIEGNHKGSQPFVLWKNRQYASHRRSLNRAVLSVSVGESKIQPTSDDSTTAAATVDTDLEVPVDPELRVRYEAAFEQFCSVFPDAFYISERSRDYVKESAKQDGEKGRLLSAGFHSMMGYFRDDRPLYDMILDEAGQEEIDSLWQELDFVVSAPTRQYVGFLWFERTDSRYMRDPHFDFARAENKAAASEEMIEKLAYLYLEKARVSGGTETPLQAIEYFFKEINEQIRWVEQARLKAEPAHLAAVQEFTARAYRRELTKAESDGLVSFYRLLRDDDGLSHEEAIQDTIVSVLMSPFFCYRVDLIGKGDGQRPLTDDELASRLSYFLWSSSPDAELLDVAASGRLTQRENLLAQARRMLDDGRVRGLAAEFAGNWLDIRRFEEHNAVDRERFPQFTDELRQAMFEEPIRFFIDVAQHDRSVLEFLDADHTFVNAELARHYGLPDSGISKTEWRRVGRASDFGRGGLLPMSVFLTKNAPGLRTSPVKRGYWVVRRLLGERIPPPPPNVPELPDDESKLGELTLREALAKHREHASCAGCHERFDSIGLAFEGFGPVGERRDKDLGGRPVDANAVFPGGTEGQGVNDLRKYLINHRGDEFVDNLIRKLVSYALGRSLILPDELLIRDLHANLRANDYRFGSLLEGIVTSPQFLSKRGANHLVRE
ncbi:MAG: mono/diheme cytochrome c family protein, partial [Porticoccaceae bacterium]